MGQPVAVPQSIDDVPHVPQIRRIGSDPANPIFKGLTQSEPRDAQRLQTAQTAPFPPMPIQPGASTRIPAPPPDAPHRVNNTTITPITRPVLPDSLPEPDSFALHRPDVSAPAPSQVTAPVAQQTPMQTLHSNAPQIVARLLDQAVHTPGRVVEVRLNPEELGQVRMLLTLAETTAVLTLSADRSETLDALRRHAELLSRDLRALGYDDVQFAFDHGTHPHTGQSHDDRAQTATGDQTPTDTPHGTNTETPTPRLTRQGSAGVDLRL